MNPNKNKSLESRIAERIARIEGDVFLRDDFKDLGNYNQVGRGLRRLTAKGKLVRIGYGLYARPSTFTFSGKVLPKKGLPDIAVEALKRLNVEVVPSRCTLAYNAGLTTQVPTGRVIAVKGRISRKIGYDGKYISYERAS